MPHLTRSISIESIRTESAEQILAREWLVTNGLGGYSSGTIIGVNTRRYHGLLIAAMPAPMGRVVMLNSLFETITTDSGQSVSLRPSYDTVSMHDIAPSASLKNFTLEMGLPIWHYRSADITLEKRILMPHMQNSVYISYSLQPPSPPITLSIKPALHFRMHESPVNDHWDQLYTLSITQDRFEIISQDLPALRLKLAADDFSFTSTQAQEEHFYIAEAQRGYESIGKLWVPGYFQVRLEPGKPVTFMASTESWPQLLALSPAQASGSETIRRKQIVNNCPAASADTFASELILASDQFLITPVGRSADAIRASATGDDVRTVIAGYHWFTDWGRDTMISLEGLTLCTGRTIEARWILRTFAYYIKDGLIPNMFPEHSNEGRYNTADATLWFFHALDRYLLATGDLVTLRLLIPKLREIIEFHLHGTRYGISVDPADGLLRQGQEHLQLTWMDAKVGDWVVTPRRGKAVEINALWYNALCLTADWLQKENFTDDAARYRDYAQKVRQSFNKRFWYQQGSYLYDVVDGESGDDTAFRPNQLFAISLTNPILENEYWSLVIDQVGEKLLTPLGLRSLAPGHPDYKEKYMGHLRARDAAYHQGTVWAWLIGPYIDAYLKLHPEELTRARAMLTGFDEHLSQSCVGSINEVFDAQSPFWPRGCVAQAWSVAEVLRCWLKTAPQK